MPIFLLPFLVCAIGNNIHHKKQIEVEKQRLAIEQKQYDLNVAMWNESHSHVVVKRGVRVYVHKDN
jgi:hypothetical protein